jgi:hypothetical protein
MRRNVRRVAVCVALAAGLSLIETAGAEATTVTIGSPLTAAFVQTDLGATVTIANTALPEPGAIVASPTTGAIIRWRIGNAMGGPFRLQVLRPTLSGSYTAVATSAPVTPIGAVVENLPTNLPIAAGDVIALQDTNSVDKIGTATPAGSSVSFWLPPLADGVTRDSTGSQAGELAYNADVQTGPSLGAITPASGPITGGTSVVISGRDFAGASAVSFGAKPATSFTVDSDTQVSAISPKGTGVGPVDVSVTTVAGKSPTSPADRFTYKGCVVPNLKGKSLKADKRALKKSGCRLGKVKGKKMKGAKVKRQSAKPGTVLPSGAKVNVKLG